MEQVTEPHVVELRNKDSIRTLYTPKRQLLTDWSIYLFILLKPGHKYLYMATIICPEHLVRASRYQWLSVKHVYHLKPFTVCSPGSMPVDTCISGSY